jgi:hypothetical protein
LCERLKLVPSFEFQVSSSRFSVLSSRFSVLGSQFSVLSSQFSVARPQPGSRMTNHESRRCGAPYNPPPGALVGPGRIWRFRPHDAPGGPSRGAGQCTETATKSTPRQSRPRYPTSTVFPGRQASCQRGSRQERTSTPRVAVSGQPGSQCVPGPEQRGCRRHAGGGRIAETHEVSWYHEWE